MFKKAIALLLAGLITASSLVSSFAEPSVEMVSDNDLKYGIETRLSRFNQISINGTSGYSGLFHSLKKVIGLSIWVQFAQENKSQIVGGTVDVYRKQLLDAVKSFNDTYSVNTGDMEPLKLDEAWFTADNIDIAALDKISAEYINKYMDTIMKEDPVEEDCVKANKKTLRRIYDLIEGFIIEVRSANSLFPADIVTNQDGSYSTKSKGSFELKGVSRCNNIMSDDKKAKILRMAKEMSASEMQEAKPESIDNKLVLLDRFFKDGTYTSGELLNAYYMIFASSALYDPFVSHIGDDTFIDGLMYMTGESEKDSDLLQLYGEAKMYKKPLFYREIDMASGKATGNAKPITFSDFIDKVLNGEAGALCMQKGMLAKSVDDNSYNYYKIDRFKYKSSTSVENTDKENKTDAPQTQGGMMGGGTGSFLGPGSFLTPDTTMPQGTTNQGTTDQNATQQNGGTTQQGSGTTDQNATQQGGGTTQQNNGTTQQGTPPDSAASGGNNTPNAPDPGAPASSANPGAPEPDPSNTINQLSGIAIDNSGSAGDAPNEQGADGSYGAGTTQDHNNTYDNSEVDWSETLKDTQHNPDNVTLTNEDQMTPSMFTWGTYENNRKIHMGTILLTNILKDVKNIEKLKKENRGVFINCFGDIVTEDDLVIIPGASNPAFYNDGAEYYPYTVAFLKHYPGLDPNSKIFKTQNSSQNDKYCIVIEDSFIDEIKRKAEDTVEEIKDAVTGGSSAKPDAPSAPEDKKDKDKDKKDEESDKEDKEKLKVVEGSRLKADNDYKIYTRQIQTENDVKIQAKPEVDLGLQTQMSEVGDGIESMVIFRQLKFDGKFLNTLIYNAKEALNTLTGKDEAFMIKTLTASMSNDSLEILYASDLKNLTPKDLGLIAHNYYWGIMDDGTGSLSTPNEKLNIETISQWLLPEALNGLSNAKSYIKHKVESYDEIKDDFFASFKSMVKSFIKDIVESFGDVRGVLGFKNAYQDPIFGGIMVFSREYAPYLIAVIILFTVFKFMSSRADFTSTIFYTAIVLVVTFLYTSVIPIYIPMLLNFFNNNISRDLSYTALGYKAEAYEKLYTRKEDDNGRISQLSSSINLYKLDSEGLRYIAKNKGLKPNNLINGDVYSIDKDAGIYLEGNIIKANLDKMFINYPITGKYVSNGNGGLYYKLKCDKMVSSALDYYTPWNLVMNNFIDQLNTFSQVYQLERSTLNYDGMTKDSFVVNSFINSSIYLLPNDWESIGKMVEPEMLDKLKETFPGDNRDFLGLRNLLIEPPKPEAVESLWYKTMLLNNYMYTENDDRSEEEEERLKRRINDLITSVNNLTKVFIEKHRKDFECMSDENIIKVISVYATTVLSQKTSEYSEMIYPLYINYEELRLKDVLVASYTNAKDRLESESIDIVDYIDYSIGIGGTILLAVLMFMCYLFTVFVNTLIPLLYLALAVLLLMKLVTRRSPVGLVKGYLKCIGIIFVCCSLHTLSYSLIYNYLHGGLKSLALQIVFMELLTETVFRILVAIKSNWTEMGNGYMYKATPAALKWLNPVIASMIVRARFADLRDSAKPDPERDSKTDKMLRAFANGKSVDEIYDDSVMLRGKIREHDKNQHKRASTIKEVSKTDLDSFRNH